MAIRGPSSRSAIMSAAYDTDRVAPLASEIGRLSFHADVTAAAASTNVNIQGSGAARGNIATTAAHPRVITSATKICAARGNFHHDKPSAPATPTVSLVIGAPRRTARTP